MAVRAVDVHNLKPLVGTELGVSDWYLVTQEEVNLFADATHDHQWIHVDPERAKRESPFGTTIAHGYYTLALAPHLLSQILVVAGIRLAVNYGLDRLRFPAPLKIGDWVRLRASLVKVEELPDAVQTLLELTWEIRGGAKPACVAEVIYRYYP